MASSRIDWDNVTLHPDSAAELLDEFKALPLADRIKSAKAAFLPDLEQRLADEGNTTQDIECLRAEIEFCNGNVPVQRQSDTKKVPAFAGGPLSATEIGADELPKSLIEGLVHRHSLTTVTGASKAGKSVAVTQAAMAIASGAAFLGLGTRRARVLYISLEMTAALMRERIMSISADTGIPMPDFEKWFRLWAPTGTDIAALDLLREEGRDYLVEVIEREGIKVVVLDTLYKFALGANPNENAEMQPLFSNISDIAQKTGAAIIIIDHAGKGQQGGPVSHSAIGASIKGGASRTIAAIRREGDGWSIDVESHFGNWDAPIAYARPVRDDGVKGFGCTRTSAAEARGINLEAVRRVFHNHAEGDPLVFVTQKKLIEALKAERLVDGDSLDAGQRVVGAIVSSYGFDREGEDRILGKYPIWITRGGPGKATRYEWNEFVYQRISEVTGVTGATG